MKKYLIFGEAVIPSARHSAITYFFRFFLNYFSSLKFSLTILQKYGRIIMYLQDYYCEYSVYNLISNTLSQRNIGQRSVVWRC